MMEHAMPEPVRDELPGLARIREEWERQRRPELFALRVALEEGWQVAPPVLARRAGALPWRRHTVYCLVLQRPFRKGHASLVLQVPDGAEIRALLAARGWAIDHPGR